MSAPTSAPGVSVLNTDSIDRFRATVNESFVPLRIDAGPASFHGSMRAATAAGVSFTDLRATAHVVERTAELAALTPRPSYKLSVMLAGTGILVQDGREAVLREGDLAIYDTSRPYTLGFESALRTVIVMFPHEALSVPGDEISQLTAVRMAGDDGLGAIVGPFLARLGAHPEELAGAGGTRLALSALDLVSALLTRELGVAGSSSTPHHDLRQRVCAYIDERLASPELGPRTIAAAHFVSVRHLHAVFQEAGSTVSATIRARRLERCRRDLADPSWAHATVAAIGARWGFPDAAHFSRTFATAYGVSPSAYRAPARG